jgi:hypothetical protein
MNDVNVQAVSARIREHHFIQYRLRGGDYSWNSLSNPSECPTAAAVNLQTLRAQDPAFEFRLRILPFHTSP